MRRRTIVGVTLGAVLAAMPLAGHALTAPSITLQSPASSHATRGDLDVRWSYTGFHRTTPVDIEVAAGDGVFRRVGRTVVDNGTPGYTGSYTLSTGGFADGTDYTVRVIMPTRRSVSSAVSPITIDNTGPTSTVTAESVTEPAPATSITADVEGTATDAISAVTGVVVTFTNSAGSETVREATCSCGTPSVTWSVSTDGLPPGRYSVQAVATDALGNVGEPGSADMVIVGTPDDPTPAVVATIQGVVGAATDLAGDVVGTVTGTTTVGDTVDTVTEIVETPPTVEVPTFDETIKEVTSQ